MWHKNPNMLTCTIRHRSGVCKLCENIALVLFKCNFFSIKSIPLAGRCKLIPVNTLTPKLECSWTSYQRPRAIKEIRFMCDSWNRKLELQWVSKLSQFSVRKSIVCEWILNRVDVFVWTGDDPVSILCILVVFVMKQTDDNPVMGSSDNSQS